MKSRFIFLLCMVTAIALTAQEPQLHPEQVGSYGATADQLLVAEGGTNSTVFKSAATLGLLTAEVDGSVTNEAQTFTTSGGATPTLNLSQVAGTGGGSVTLAGAGGLTVNQSGSTVTFTQTAGATYTGTAPVTVTGSVISLASSGVTAGTYNNVTVAANGTVTSGSNTAYLTTEVDGSTTNEIQTVSRTSTNNTASLSLSGGSISVEDVPATEDFAPTSGTTVTLTGTLPTDVTKYRFMRNGVVQNYGAGKGVVSINTSTKVVTVLRTFASGEQFQVIYPKQ